MMHLGYSAHFHYIQQMILMFKCKIHYTESIEEYILLIKIIFRAKLGTGLLSGRYSLPPSGSHENPGIAPNMFKNLIGKNHPDFSSKKQQDAQEYLLHFINILEVQLNY